MWPQSPSPLASVAGRPPRLIHSMLRTPGNVRATRPKPGEMYCYGRVALTFPGVRSIEWISRGGRPATDASGEGDWGHIDTFLRDGNTYQLTGDWGHVRFESDAPVVTDR